MFTNFYKLASESNILKHKKRPNAQSIEPSVRKSELSPGADPTMASLQLRMWQLPSQAALLGQVSSLTPSFSLH